MDRRKFLKSLVATAVIAPVVAKALPLPLTSKSKPFDIYGCDLSDKNELGDFFDVFTCTYTGTGENKSTKISLPFEPGMIIIRPV